jgi:N utilization substance protein A
MMRILEDVFKSIMKKKYGTDENVEITINPEKGDLEILRVREIVDDNSEDIWDPDKIALSDALKIEPDFVVGEDVTEIIRIEDFGRRTVMAAKQALVQKVKDLEKEKLFNIYKDRVGDVMIGEVYQVTPREVLLIDGPGNELILPRNEQIPKDMFRKGDNIKAVVQKVEMINGNPKIIMSRTSPVFLERLFEAEVPEIQDGIIGIRKVVREPGERAKIAVESFDDRVDPVGACVGMKGSRINNIVRELQNENIDVINYTDNMELYIARALSPAKINSMKIDEKNGRVAVFLKPEQVSLAIGKGGLNIKLASRLVGYEIDVYRESEEFVEDADDIMLDEFNDEIEQWIINEFKGIGLDTAKRVLSTPIEDLVRRTDLEEETIEEVFKVLKQEFESE